MKPLILIIDDYKDILDTLKMILEFNNFNVLTANNSKEALEVLSTHKIPPDLIISDIMMPGMNGYELFNKITLNSNWNHIPFIFLSAKSSPEDIRYGKELGADDYLTKPFNEEDLLAIIRGKIERNKTSKLISKEVYSLLSSINIPENLKKKKEKKTLEEIVLCWVIWDDVYGPKLKEYYTINNKLSYSIDKISFQLYNAAATVYGQEGFSKPEGILLNIDNIKRDGYIFFDSYPDENQRSGEQEFMLGIIALNINYFYSLKIKKILSELSEKIKNNKEYTLREYWESISDLLALPII
ncbi:MAG: response regulator [Candidatus Lokiarchaeota archaeon]|nr:response regulator [Candidatus Lokiarchaeota archaeon]